MKTYTFLVEIASRNSEGVVVIESKTISAKGKDEIEARRDVIHRVQGDEGKTGKWVKKITLKGKADKELIEA